jgi:hypothetical protein
LNENKKDFVAKTPYGKFSVKILASVPLKDEVDTIICTLSFCKGLEGILEHCMEAGHFLFLNSDSSGIEGNPTITNYGYFWRILGKEIGNTEKTNLIFPVELMDCDWEKYCKAMMIVIMLKSGQKELALNLGKYWGIAIEGY